jgi:FAD/FMN-containing dehydrogenase
MAMAPGSPRAVTVGAGTRMEVLLAFLAKNGAGLSSVPAVGHISVGGALAIDAHGAAVPAAGESPQPGQAFGSLSNLVLSLDAVVWNATTSLYELRTFTRGEPEAKALLTHLGRAFVTSVTLQVGPGQNLRCQSYTSVCAADLFAAPANAGSHSFASYLAQAGRVETIQYPFTTNPWLKVWSVCPTKPLLSRATNVPYNYVFSDVIPLPVAELVNEIIAGNVESAPALGAAEYAVTVAGLLATLSADLWGPAFATQLYIQPTTLRLAEGGGVVICRRADVQRVVSEFMAQYESLVAQYQARGQYPMNGPVEIRCTGLDHGAAVLASGAEPPSISALLERRDHPEWDTGVWTNMLTIPATPYASDFYAEMEAWARTNFASYAAVRVEWSKGWAHTSSGPWTDVHALTVTIPDDFRVARDADEDWDWALATLDALDPHRIFSNPLLDTLAP